MHEARIKVTKKGSDFQVELLDVTNSETVLESGTTFEESLSRGFPDIIVDGQVLNASKMKTEYSQILTLGADRRQKFGKYLYRLLTPDNIEQKWNQLRVQHKDDGLTTLLEIHPVDWRSLPWELLYSRQMHLYHDQKHAIGLRIPDGQAAAPNNCRWPLRMLVIIGGDTGNGRIKWEDELRAIKCGIFQFSLRIDLTVLPPLLTVEVVENEIRRLRPHILHFIGHGTSNDGGKLLLVGPGGNTFWHRDQIRATLSGLNSDEVPRIALINACQTAGADGILGDTAVAEAFADIGCPAVIAMRGDIFGNAASTFAEGFYKQLAKLGINRPDRAFCQAVANISTTQGIDQRVWSLPRIFFQETVQAVFPINGECGGFDKVCGKYDDLKDLRPFVDRVPERFGLYQETNAWLNEIEPAHNILIIRGTGNVGKTWLLQALVYVASLRGFQTAYCDFSDKNYDVYGFLELLRKGKDEPNKYFSRPFVPRGASPNPFSDFDTQYGTATPSSPRGNEDIISPLVEAMVRGLKEAAQSSPVVLAFDHVKNLLLEDWKKYLSESIFKPAAQGDLGTAIRIVIAADQVEWDNYNLKSIRAKQLELKSLPSEIFKEIVLDYFLHQLKEGFDHSGPEFAKVAATVNSMAEIYESGAELQLSELPVIKGLSPFRRIF